MHEAEQLTAVVQETTFRNEDNGYTVLRVGSGRSQQTVVGVMPELSPGENVTFEGYWTEHPVYGRQFNARACAITPPTGKSAIEKFESHPRNFYAGYIKVETEETVQYFVNLRCAEFFENACLIYVGGGITAESSPEKEWRETELKSEAILKNLEFE